MEFLSNIISKKNKKILIDGLWNNNQALVALLGLCPMLAVTNNFINSLGLGLVTAFVLIVSNVTISFFSRFISEEIRIPVFVLLISSLVTIADIFMQAFFYQLHQVLGIFIPLIVTNCAILGRAEVFASKNNCFESFLDGLFISIGFGTILVLLGSIREIIGQGTLFNQAELLLGSFGKQMEIEIISDYQGVLLAILPPGAFIGLALIVALKQYLDHKFN